MWVMRTKLLFTLPNSFAKARVGVQPTRTSAEISGLQLPTSLLLTFLQTNSHIVSLVPCSSHQDLRSLILDPGPRIQGPASWIHDSGSQIQDPGSRKLDPGSWILDAGSRGLDPESTDSPWILNDFLKRKIMDVHGLSLILHDFI